MRRVLFYMVLFALGAPVALVAQLAAPLVVSSVAADPGGETVTVSGANFGRRPLVTLDLLPVTVRVAVDAQIVVAVPVSRMPPGTYLLTVSRGPNADDTASMPLTIAGAAATVAPVPAEAVPLPSASDAAALIGSAPLTVADVDREWARRDPGGYLAAARLLYQNRRRVADEVIADRLLAEEAARRNMSVDALLAEELPRRRIAMPDSAVTSIYRSLGDRARGASVEQLRPAIRAWLAEHTERELAKMGFIEELTKVATRAEVRLLSPRVDVAVSSSDPTLGPATAAVTLAVFGDFESEGYATMAGAFGRVRDLFGDRVRIVFKQLPVLGPESVSIAESSACAARLGRFWEFHDLVVSQPGPFDVPRLKSIARDAKIEEAGFARCVDGGETRDLVRQALDEAGRYGVGDSPSVMVNGRLAPPPPPFLPPFEFFKRLVEEELQRQSRR